MKTPELPRPGRPRSQGVLIALLAIPALACNSADGVEEAAKQAGPKAAVSAEAPPLEPAEAADVLTAVHEPGARAVLVNVWATWCVPCREEFPDLMRVYREHREDGLRLVLVSADFEDQEAQARAFLGEQGVDFRSYHKTGDDMEFIDGLEPRWSGALPVTLLFDEEGRQVDFWEGKASYETLKRKVTAALAG